MFCSTERCTSSAPFVPQSKAQFERLPAMRANDPAKRDEESPRRGDLRQVARVRKEIDLEQHLDGLHPREVDYIHSKCGGLIEVERNGSPDLWAKAARGQNRECWPIERQLRVLTSP